MLAATDSVAISKKSMHHNNILHIDVYIRTNAFASHFIVNGRAMGKEIDFEGRWLYMF